MRHKFLQKSTINLEMPVVSLRGVSAGYTDRSVLRELTFDIKPGISILLGTNGAGKTTLFRLISGVLGPKSGNILVFGHNPFHEIGIKKRIGYLGHRSGLSSALTVLDNLVFWGQIIGLSKSEMEARTSELIELFNISDLINCPVQTLSRGQIQRVALSRCFLGAPDLLLLDEPTAGLDPIAIRDFFHHLNQISANGVTIVYSTHNIFEAKQFGTETIIMANGKRVAQGTIDQLCQKYLGRLTVILRVNDDPRFVFEKLGHDFQYKNGTWHMQIPSSEEKEILLQNLAQYGLKITEIRDRPEDLSDLLERVTEDHA